MGKAAFSENSGDSFGAAIRLDQGNGDGQVTIALLENGAVVGWLENQETLIVIRRAGAWRFDLVAISVSPRRANNNTCGDDGGSQRPVYAASGIRIKRI